MEPLLSRRVPDLQLDFLPPELDGLDLEVNTDRRDECVVERVVREPEQDAEHNSVHWWYINITLSTTQDYVTLRVSTID